MCVVKSWMMGFAVVSMMSGVGCMEGVAGGDGADGAMGQVVVPLVASGGDGASYRLPPGTQMILSKEGYLRQVAIDGDGPSLTVSVPPGDYLPPFVFDSAGHTTTWPLDRIEADGTTTRVEATLDPGAEFTVTEGETTSLTLQFHTKVAGVITFTLASVDVDIAIEEGAASSYRIEMAGIGMSHFLNQEVAVLPDLPPFHDLVVTAQTTSPWRLAGATTACADVRITWQSSEDQIRVIDEALDQAAPHTVCVAQLAPQLAQLSLPHTRIGPPRTDLLSGFGTVRVSSSFAVDLNVDVFDGTTLRLGALARIIQTSTQLGINFEGQREDGSFQQLANVFEFGGGHAQLTAL